MAKDNFSKLLYMLNVPWSWIEQRPQIVAKGLTEHMDVTCVAPKSVKRAVLHPFRSGREDAVASMPCWILPSRIQNSAVDRIVQGFNRRRIGNALGGFDAVWLSHPDQIDHIPNSYSGLVVYDCMDDHASMAELGKRDFIANQEARLLDRADIVFVTSEHLRTKIGRSDAVLVRNGYKQGTLRPVANAAVGGSHTIAYFGTVSQWFDFDAVTAVATKVPGVRFRIIGPTEMRVPIDGVEYVGPIEHSALYRVVEDCGCLIMPFRVNDIIKAVDPVKLYEYIAFGKCVVSVRYPEVERFSEYVYFYETKDDLVGLVSSLASRGFPPKYTEESRKEFLAENTWEHRVEVMRTVLAVRGIELR